MLLNRQLRRATSALRSLTTARECTRTMRALTTLVALVAVVLAGCGGDEPAAPEDGLREIDRQLLAAAYENDVAAARRLVEQGADVNVKDDSQQSAYLIATSEVGDDPRLLDLTLDAGADVGAKDSFNGTGLIRAAERGYATIVARLLKTDIELDHVNRLGLDRAARGGDPRRGRAPAHPHGKTARRGGRRRRHPRQERHDGPRPRAAQRLRRDRADPGRRDRPRCSTRLLPKRDAQRGSRAGGRVEDVDRERSHDGLQPGAVVGAGACGAAPGVGRHVVPRAGDRAAAR